MEQQKFIDNLTNITLTPSSLDELRKFIFTLAVQGKLVEQNPNDESAVELINRIPESALMKKSSFKISMTEKPYDLPLGWMWTALSEIGEVNPRNYEDDDTKASSFIPMTYIPEEYSGKLRFDIRPWGEIRKGFTHLKENSEPTVHSWHLTAI
jgi:type I restriction enzyme, S subunit